MLLSKCGAKAVRFSLVLLLVFILLPPWGGAKKSEASSGVLAGWRFVVDPGHGGGDSGAVGPTGLMEKEVNLDVSLRLRDLLEGEGATVYMTRTSDIAVSITQRWQMANNLGVDRFISIHHNAYPNDPSVNGTETLISVYAGSEAFDLADKAQDELVWELGLPDRGVKRVSYVGVLNNTYMPAILTEASFISNSQEEQRLRDPYYRQREAEAIFRGVVHHCGGPLAYFIKPDEGTILYGAASAKLSVPRPETVSQVNYYVDDHLDGAETVSPYQHQLDTTIYQDGVHELWAEIIYEDGRMIEASSYISIANVTARNWYFAEGYTGAGFDEWLTVLNPNDIDVELTVSYCFNREPPLVKNYLLYGMTRTTINVNAEVGAGREVSMQLGASAPVVAERPLYFNYMGKWSGGDVVLGANAPAREWYFAEGYTGGGFEEYLCLYNPNDYPITVNVDFLMEDSRVNMSKNYGLAGKTRATLFINQVAGSNRNLSFKVSGVQQNHTLVAERVMYFNYLNKWSGGSAAIGANMPSTKWYFAEGCTSPGFEEYLCIQNPNDSATLVTIDYVTSAGTTIRREKTVAAKSRATIQVNGDAGKNLDLSVVLTSGLPIVAERPIYFNYQGWAPGGDLGRGIVEPSAIWYFSEGYTGSGFDMFLCLLNPEPYEADVRLLFYLPGGDIAKISYKLPGNSRRTLLVNHMIYSSGDVALCIIADRPIVAERPIYFRYLNKWAGGSNYSGFYPGLR